MAADSPFSCIRVRAGLTPSADHALASVLLLGGSGGRDRGDAANGSDGMDRAGFGARIDARAVP
jgi:hypothetical protein